MLNQFAAALFGEINHHVHAKNNVHFADVHAVRRFHPNEIDHFAQAGANLLAAVYRLKMRGQLFSLTLAMLRPE